MLIRFIVLLCGGFWKLKGKCLVSSWHILKRFYIILYHYYQFYYSSSIAWNSHFESKPLFPHGLHGIFVSGEAKIGSNCILFQQVTIGSNTLIDSKGLGAPTIGDNCYIGAGAKIIGKIRIGNNVRIGANAVVYRDVPDDSTVISNRQITIQRKYSAANRLYFRRGKGEWVYFENAKLQVEKDISCLEKLNKAFNL
jgi:serine O-acetyltransferase